MNISNSKTKQILQKRGWPNKNKLDEEKAKVKQRINENLIKEKLKIKRVKEEQMLIQIEKLNIEMFGIKKKQMLKNK